MKAAVALEAGDAEKARCVGDRFHDLELAFTLYDTGMTMKQYENLPQKMQPLMLYVGRAKRHIQRMRAETGRFF
jgi:hypothetical protein